MNHREHREELRISLCSQREFPLKDITNRIISCAIEIHATLCPGLTDNLEYTEGEA
ncbi:MAG: hypothetical protein ABII25_04380 [bacterium]